MIDPGTKQRDEFRNRAPMQNKTIIKRHEPTNNSNRKRVEANQNLLKQEKSHRLA